MIYFLCLLLFFQRTWLINVNKKGCNSCKLWSITKYSKINSHQQNQLFSHADDLDIGSVQFLDLPHIYRGFYREISPNNPNSICLSHFSVPFPLFQLFPFTNIRCTSFFYPFLECKHHNHRILVCFVHLHVNRTWASGRQWISICWKKWINTELFLKN